jgi:RecA/RadA recombinase
MAAKKKKQDTKEVPQAPARARPSLIKSYAFNVMDDENEDLIQVTREALFSIQSRRKNHPTGFRTLGEMQNSLIPYRHFYMQWAVGNYGIPEGSLLEIIGAQHLGKSTFAHWLIGGAMLNGIPAILLESENKPLLEDWASRAMHTDRTLATKMVRRMGGVKVKSLEQMEAELTDWVEVMRGRRPGAKRVIPLETPMLFVIDTYSKLLSPGEAAGFLDYGDNMESAKKKKFKSTGEGSNLGHAKWSAAWGRRLPTLLDALNTVGIVISHQQDKIDMSGGGASFMAADVGALYNDTKIGGRSLGQNATMQFIMANKGLLKNGNGDKIGQTVRVRVAKNSVGAKDRLVEFDLFHSDFEDTETYQSPNVSFDRPMCEWMAENGHLETTVLRKRYSSPVLGLSNVSAEEFSTVFHSPEFASVRNDLGQVLGIRGYERDVDMAVEELDDART